MNINEKNIHRRDVFIDFEEKTHKYTVNNKRLISVSQLIKRYFGEFDADKILNLYYKRWMRDKNSEYYGMSREEIKQKWEDNKNHAASHGTAVHEQIEKYILGEEPHTPYPEFKQFKVFTNRKYNWKPYRVEWIIYDEDLMIGGTIDAVYKDSQTGKYYIIDWKANNKITKNNSYQKGLYPLNFFIDGYKHSH